MATSKLVLSMSTIDGDKSFIYGDVDPDTTTAKVKALGAALVTNGDIFINTPLELKAAKLVTTEESSYDISD